MLEITGEINTACQQPELSAEPVTYLTPRKSRKISWATILLPFQRLAYRLLTIGPCRKGTDNDWRPQTMEEKMSDFVRQLRHQLGMTQEEFAHALGITVGTVNRWENRRFRPSKLARATIMEFARRHGVPMGTGDPDVGMVHAESVKVAS